MHKATEWACVNQSPTKLLRGG